MYKKVLVATDGSEYSLRAARKAVALHQQTKCRITVFHSIKHRCISRKISLFIPAFSTSEREEYTIPEDDYWEIYGRSEAAGKRVLGETLQVFENEGLEVEGKLEMDIDPAQFATDAAEKEGYDLVIAGS